MDQLFRLRFGRREHAVCPGDGRVALPAPMGDTQADAAKILQQRQLQHDREGPQFAQLQGLDGLVGGNELGGVVGVHTAVHVGDQLQGQIVDAGKTG